MDYVFFIDVRDIIKRTLNLDYKGKVGVTLSKIYSLVTFLAHYYYYYYYYH